MSSFYRKKPLVIEAFQMTLNRRWDNSEWPEWLNKAWNLETGEGAMWIDPDDPKGEHLVLGTKEGVHRVSWDDWIIRGIQGELYACKPGIFEATYESAVQQAREAQMTWEEKVLDAHEGRWPCIHGQPCECWREVPHA